jgi:Fe-S-cluster containining protein
MIAMCQRKPHREDLPPGSCLCDHCPAKCCKYFALPIETPTDRKAFDYLRWYLMHERATIFIEEETWYLLVHTTCKHLQADNRCGIYETRPQICRDYSTDNCEYEDTWVYDFYLETAEQVEEYIEARFGSTDRDCIRSPEPIGLPILS